MGGILFTAKIDDSYILRVGGAGGGGGSTAAAAAAAPSGRKSSVVAVRGEDPGSGKSNDNKADRTSAGNSGRRGPQNTGAGRKSSVAESKSNRGGADLAPGATKRVALAAMGGKSVEVYPSLARSLARSLIH